MVGFDGKVSGVVLEIFVITCHVHRPEGRFGVFAILERMFPKKG